MDILKRFMDIRNLSIYTLTQRALLQGDEIDVRQQEWALLQFNQRDIVTFSFFRAAVAYAIFERTSGFKPSS